MSFELATGTPCDKRLPRGIGDVDGDIVEGGMFVPSGVPPPLAIGVPLDGPG